MPPQPQKLQLRDGRPLAHKVVGWSIISLGLGLAVVNYGEEFDLPLMRGGHKEAHFLIGLLIAAAGTWWLGRFGRAGD